jgi:hypothetical protein
MLSCSHALHRQEFVVELIWTKGEECVFVAPRIGFFSFFAELRHRNLRSQHNVYNVIKENILRFDSCIDINNNTARQLDKSPGHVSRVSDQKLPHISFCNTAGAKTRKIDRWRPEEYNVRVCFMNFLNFQVIDESSNFGGGINQRFTAYCLIPKKIWNQKVKPANNAVHIVV